MTPNAAPAKTNWSYRFDMLSPSMKSTMSSISRRSMQLKSSALERAGGYGRRSGVRR
ncbi:MAG: hypothetical protein QM775_26525 [Pirellulales bacterium]